MTEEKQSLSVPLPIQGHDPRLDKYNKIAAVHKRIVEAKWRSGNANMPLTVSPDLVLHCEEVIAFLAEELLRLRLLVEDGVTCDSLQEEKA